MQYHARLYSEFPRDSSGFLVDWQVLSLTGALPGVYNQSNFRMRRAGIMLCPARTTRRWEAADTKACRKIP